MISSIGSTFLISALFFNVYTIISMFVFLKCKKIEFKISSFYSLYSSTFLIITASLILVRELIQSNFNIDYISKYSSINTPLVYKITGLWAGMEGSLLFWLLILSLYSISVIIIHKKKHQILMPWVVIVLMFVQLFFLIICCFFEDPFKPSDQLLNALKTPPVIEDYQGPIEEEPEDYGKTIGGKRVEHINVFSETEYKNWKKSGLTKEEYRKRKNRLNIGRTIDKDKWENQQNWTSPIGTMKYGGIAGPGDPPKKKSKFNTFGFYDFGEKDILGNYKDFIAGGTLDYPIGDKQKIGVTGSLFQNLNFNRNPHEVGVTVPAAGLTYSPNQRSTYHGGIEVPIISNIPYVGTIAEPKGVARVNVRPWQNWEFGAEVKSDLNKSVDVAAEAKYFGENTDLFVRGMYNTMHGLSFMGSARHTFGGKKKGEPKDIMRYGGKVKKKDCNCKNK